MKQKLFEELLESVREAKAIMRGEKKPSRVFVYDEPNVKTMPMRLPRRRSAPKRESRHGVVSPVE